MKIVVTVRKLDNWKEKLIRNIFQTGFFLIKNTHYFVARTSQHKNLKWEVPRKFPTLLREYKLWVT